MFGRIGLWFFVAVSLLLSGTAVAQVPSAAEPGAVERGIEERLPKPLPSPPLSIPQRIEGPEAPAGSEDKKFVLSEIAIKGMTVYEPADLEPLYAAFIDTEISLKAAYDIAKQISARYGQDGYALIKVYIPAQTIEGGVLVIGVVEGFIDQIKIENEEQDRRGLLRRTLEPILASRPIRTDVLERAIYLANDLHGITVKTSLESSKTTPGGTDLIVAVEDKKLDATASFDNRGTESSGPNEASLSASGSNILGLYERTSVTYLTTTQRSELTYISLSHDEILDADGLALNVKGVRSRSQAGTQALRDLDLTSKSDTFSATLSYPLLRGRQQTLKLSGSFSYKNTRSMQLAVPSSVDRIRAAELGIDYSLGDSWNGTNTASVQLRQGLPILNATGNGSPLLSRSGGRNDFTKLVGTLSRTQTLPNNFSLYAAATGQRSITPLLSSEECGMGGETFGRAYDSSEITGDHCAGASLEARYIPPVEWPLGGGLQVYGFYDIGAIWNRAATAGTDAKATLASAGGGLRFNLTDYVSGSFEAAKPLTRPVDAENDTGDGNATRFFFRLTARY